ncbi:dialkylrecorsinol condensing enzyme DarA [Zobellia uliginosa]|uniref:dialkylrecorsinol condensing enzyme DarA n=1 Tax=Zobellia uliginosa TaxID=143224 RepID=UPI0026E22BD0|nr:dialkylrecorsinol condensing enzyme DarA [Zobellia uliginosa]MDO6516448.1 dialkylresorcinol condensing enzyme DarA [Zobellia uliginosa]
MKEVLVVYYSQTGQLRSIIDSVISPLQQESINITYHQILPKTPYGFPWKKERFFDVFPEAFLQIPTEINTPDASVLSRKYDLVILGHQVWYLSPSIPLNSFLTSEAAKTLLNDTPVITVIGVRNMWAMSQEKVKKILIGLNAKLVGNIALVDKSPNHVSVITIVYWMLQGKKDRMWGIFPKPGVSENTIASADKFGHPIKEALMASDFSSLQEKLNDLNASKISNLLVQMDKRGNLLFSKWANLIRKKGNQGDPARKKWLRLFNYYLIFAIWIIAPIVFIVFLLTYIPMYRKIQRENKYYASVDYKE